MDPEIVERRTKLTQITETDVPYTNHVQFSTKNGALIDSGIHENQVSSEEESDKLEHVSVPPEPIRPTQQLSYVPMSKYVQPKQENTNDKSNSSGYYSQSYVIDNKLGQQREGAMFVDKDGSHQHQVPVYIKQEANASRFVFNLTF